MFLLAVLYSKNLLSDEYDCFKWNWLLKVASIIGAINQNN
jgi:hypothetical protein